jgi:hypothetical protein
MYNPSDDNARYMNSLRATQILQSVYQAAAYVKATAATTIKSKMTCNQFTREDLTHLIIYATWLWAAAGFYLSKLAAYMFKAVMYCPESALKLGTVMHNATKAARAVRVVKAADSIGEITHKFRLFLSAYISNLDAPEQLGFDFESAKLILGTPLLYLSYCILNPEAAAMTPEEFAKTQEMQHIIVSDREGKAEVSVLNDEGHVVHREACAGSYVQLKNYSATAAEARREAFEAEQAALMQDIAEFVNDDDL